ncbi:NUDIX hydrolase [Clostridium chauvoei]|uniref:NUDIX hydrolase n=2 Tax=Clostridium chauvoei TaxID=46867 RepID=A0ABD4RFK8_9CLOT|nr:NUDIX hydrolase [Clostridium chauvoei]ATD55619.1 DNA mismatch repair protein MutT [Clostridium chauvoei]ATD56704.1 DNA mismatch repair protein MutT [Clostridium chauvoei]MBX7280144.1 NUDIX hydrolase [Clostridium chauvoei]MBX7282628.1 NUDIX hydrolase [Clostridium chauvoei]MBX7285035.1 NUDIX hydrolase [Clostridium chauvoei]
MSKVKINKVDMLADTKYLKLYNAEYTNKNGDLRNWTIASRKDLDTINNQFFNGLEEKIDAVIILAKHIKEDKLVIIKQFRVPLNDYVYELPAGLIDSGEDFIETVRRELKEETGLDLIEIDYEKTKQKAYVSTGMTDESVAFVYCSCDGKMSTENLEADEDIEVMLVDKEEAKNILTSDEKIDIKALLAIQNFIGY